ncbi:hypothetical protein [Metabacillus arenae]|uniref:Uncharacterized protein n=1 Tax=Metabacillus arenae TaxID=2771434 RepID=A0A926NLX5_9BACI|nr:hypothetical protein [Metabacillus arenae]MBD1380442.1 hypothetical protein [Metabacillus arenae]
MIEVIIYFLKVILNCLLGVQWVSVLLFLIIEWAIVDYYRLGFIEKPKSLLDKIGNFFMKLFMGSGYFLYMKFSKQKWILRKLYMLIALILQGILSIIVYYIITLPLDLIFLR